MQYVLTSGIILSMRMIHTTTLDNLDNIRRHGILASCSTGKRMAVWVHSAALNDWACDHVATRHKCHGEALVHLLVEVEESECRKYREGVYWIPKDVPADRILSVLLVRRVTDEIWL